MRSLDLTPIQSIIVGAITVKYFIILLNSNATFQLATQALTLVIYDEHDRKRKFTFDEAVENGSSLNLTSATHCSRSAPRECFLYVLDVRDRP